MGDRREDTPARTRLDDLAASWEEAVARLDARYARVARYLIAGMIVGLLSIAAGYLFLQGSRWEQTRDGCRRTNQITEATVKLLQSLQVRPIVVQRAEEAYPHVPPLAGPKRNTGPMSCGAFADQKVPGPRL